MKIVLSLTVWLAFTYRVAWDTKNHEDTCTFVKKLLRKMSGIFFIWTGCIFKHLLVIAVDSILFLGCTVHVCISVRDNRLKVWWNSNKWFVTYHVHKVCKSCLRWTEKQSVYHKVECCYIRNSANCCAQWRISHAKDTVDDLDKFENSMSTHSLRNWTERMNADITDVLSWPPTRKSWELQVVREKSGKMCSCS